MTYYLLSGFSALEKSAIGEVIEEMLWCIPCELIVLAIVCIDDCGDS